MPLKAILSRNPRPSIWHESREPVFWAAHLIPHDGHIVIVSEMLDPNRVNPKDRPSVVVTPPNEMKERWPCHSRAISTVLAGPPPEDPSIGTVPGKQFSA